MMSLFKQLFNFAFAWRTMRLNGKNPFFSKTMWANFFGICAWASSKYLGVEINAGDVLVLLAVVNMGLRMITKKPVGFYEEKPSGS